MQSERAYILSARASRTLYLRTRILPSALYLAAALIMLAAARLCGLH
jgi:hypothetical protein